MAGPASVVVSAALLAGCSTDDGQVEADHTHAPGQDHTSLAVGYGTRVSEVGYSLAGLQVREQPDDIGEVRFRIDDFEGEPVTDYVEEPTKESTSTSSTTTSPASATSTDPRRDGTGPHLSTCPMPAATASQLCSSPSTRAATATTSSSAVPSRCPRATRATPQPRTAR